MQNALFQGYIVVPNFYIKKKRKENSFAFVSPKGYLV